MAVLAPSLASLRAQLNAIAPGRSKAADGWIGDTAHQGRSSDHNPDAQGVVRALDITDDPAGGMDCLWLREALRASQDPRIKYVISEGQIFSSTATSARHAWEWGRYTGANGHFHHLHISVRPGLDGGHAGMWNLSRDLASPVRPTPEVSNPNTPEADLTPQEAQQLAEVHWMLSQIKPQADRLPTVQAGVDLANAGLGNVTNGVLTLLGRNQGSSLTAADIAAAIPQNLAAAVADELARRIKE